MLNRALKVIRVFHQYKQKDLAEKLGISQSHLSEIESGRKKPSGDVIEKYSEIFNIPQSNFYLFSEYIKGENNLENIRTAVASKMLSIMELFAQTSGVNLE